MPSKQLRRVKLVAVTLAVAVIVCSDPDLQRVVVRLIEALLSL
jgi:hypothetical protein